MYTTVLDDLLLHINIELQQQTCFENYITYYSSIIKMYSNIFTEAHRLYISPFTIGVRNARIVITWKFRTNSLIRNFK